MNCPLTKEEYYAFVEALGTAEKAVLHDFEKGEIFEGCMPIEVMASRGKDTLRYGTLKPVGLCEDGKRPFAVEAGIFDDSRTEKRGVSALRRDAPQHVYTIPRCFERRFLV